MAAHKLFLKGLVAWCHSFWVICIFIDWDIQCSFFFASIPKKFIFVFFLRSLCSPSKAFVLLLSCYWTTTCLRHRGPEMHLDNSSLHVLLLDLSTYTYVHQRPVLHSDVSTHWGLSFTWTCLHYRILCFTWTCFLYTGLSWTWTCLDNSSKHVLLLDISTYTTETCAALGRVYSTHWDLSFTWTCLHNRDRCAAPGRVHFTGAWTQGAVHLLYVDLK